MKYINLVFGPNKVERIVSLMEIRYNFLFYNAKPSQALTLEEMLSSVEARPDLRRLREEAELEENVESVFREFNARINPLQQKLPFPVSYNADRSLALLVYALSRWVRPEIVVETGVGYGITSALILLALKNNGKGGLISIDLHPLSDVNGQFIGIGVPQELRRCWKLLSGSSRHWLPKILDESGTIGLFVSDSANVFTLQRYEFNKVFPNLLPNGAMIFNNVSLRFQDFLKTVRGVEFYSIWQSEKTACVTLVAFKASPR